VVNALVGGWQIGGVMRYQSGQPIVFGCQGGLISGYDGCIRYNVTGQGFHSSNSGSFNNGDAIIANQNGTNFGCSQNGDGTFSGPGAGVPTLFNCSAFFDQNVSVKSGTPGVPWLFGNAPRVTGAVRSQEYFNEDFSLIKRTTIHESHALVLKVELPNAFNRHVFTRPDTGITDSTFGVSFGTISPQRTLQLTLRYEF
jgi:hypothetical protein